MSLPFHPDPQTPSMYMRLSPPPLNRLSTPPPLLLDTAMASRPVYPPSGGQETPRSEVDFDLALQLQELEINTLKDTIAMHVEATKDLRDTIAIQKEATQDFRDVIKDLRERNGDLQERNGDLQERHSDLSAKNAAHVDQRNELQETKIELAELRDDYHEARDNWNRSEELVGELNDKVNEQDDIIKDLRQQYSSLSTTYQKHSLYVSRVSAAYKAESTALRKLKNEHEELQATLTTKTGELSAAMNDLSAAYEAKEAELEELKDELQELRDHYEDYEERMEGLTTKTNEQDETIATLNTKVKQGEVDIAKQQGEAEANVKQRDDTIAELEKRLAKAKKSAAVNGLQDQAKKAELQELKDELKVLRDDLKGDVQLMHGLENQVKQRDETIVELNAKAAQQDNALAWSDQQIHEQYDTITDMKRKHAEVEMSEHANSLEVEHKEAELKELREGCEGDKKTIAELNTKVKQRDTALAHSKGQLRGRIDEIDEFMEQLRRKGFVKDNLYGVLDLF